MAKHETLVCGPASRARPGPFTVTSAALLGAALALLGHHLMRPHGEVLPGAVGDTVTLTRTVGRWHVTDNHGRSYFTNKVRVDAVHND